MLRRRAGGRGGDGGTAPLKAALAARFPEYMLPSAIMVLEALPLTPSGKVDRKALPPPDRSRPEHLSSAYVRPRSAAEERLCAIWAEVLGLGGEGAVGV